MHQSVCGLRDAGWRVSTNLIEKTLYVYESKRNQYTMYSYVFFGFQGREAVCACGRQRRQRKMRHV